MCVCMTDDSCSVLSEQCEDQPCPPDMQCVSIEANRGRYACQCPQGKLGECAGTYVSKRETIQSQHENKKMQEQQVKTNCNVTLE